MYTLASTIITGVFSMVFSKNVVRPASSTEPAKSFYELSVNNINGENVNIDGGWLNS